MAVLPVKGGQIRLTELEMRAAPGPQEVLVRMLRAPINPADLLVIDGAYAFDLAQDAPIGAEGVGTVTAVGDGVADLRPGDLVLPLSRGNWCRYRLLSLSDLVRLPAGVDLAQAAMLRINPLTARLLTDATGAQVGQVIVQNAAASAVAAWVRAIATRMGVTVIDVARRPDEALPDAIIDGPDLAHRVKVAADGKPICAALDCIAGSASGRMAECLAPNGRLIVFGHLSGEPVSVRSQLLTGGGLTIRGFSLRPAEKALGEAGRERLLAELFALHMAERLHLPVREVVPLSRAASAVEFARMSGKGRVLLDLTQ